MRTLRDAKLCVAAEALALIGDGQTIVFTGFCGGMHAEALSKGLGEYFLAHGRPRGLTLVYAAGQGNWADKGLEHVAQEGLLRRVIGGHYATCRTIGKLVFENKIEAYNLPQGVVCQLLRDIAAGRPGCITHIGLDTFVDPAHGGGRLNECSKDVLVERVELGGRTWLWYKSFPIHAALIRAWAADPLGNLVCDNEAVLTEILPAAQAAHNCGGIVIAQVRELLDKPAPPHSVRVPGILVDRIVLAAREDHPQTFAEDFNPAFVTPADSTRQTMLPPLPMDERRIIAARACDELRAGFIVNLGVGIPEGIAQIAAERSLIDRVTLTVEAGVIGGVPAGGLSFGASVHPHAIIDQPAQFDFYDGRGLDFAALGCAQVDAAGNVNVSKFGSRVAGVGGFINVTQTARRLVFCGTFTTGGLELAVAGGELRIVKEGKVRKFLANVEQVSFSARRAREVGQEVLYVTERAVFRMNEHGLELTEVAPGIDPERDVLALMDFCPLIRDLMTMPAHAFTPAL
ncbi:MAG: CoA-transferase [Chthoniobacteraceae bacterium]